MNHQEAFEKCVKRSKDGKSIDCIKGLWGVYGPKEQAEREARHYWIQYYRDGEYDKLLREEAGV